MAKFFSHIKPSIVPAGTFYSPRIFTGVLKKGVCFAPDGNGAGNGDAYVGDGPPPAAPKTNGASPSITARTPKASGDLLALAHKAEEHLKSKDVFDRESAIKSLEKIVLHLEPGQRLTWIHLIEKQLDWEDMHSLFASIKASQALSRIVPQLEYQELLDWASTREEQLECDDPAERQLAVSSLGWVVPNLEYSDRISWLKKVSARLEDENAKVRKHAVEVIGYAVPELEPRDRISWAIKIERRLEDDDEEVRQIAVKDLSKVIPHLDAEKHLALVKSIEGRLKDRKVNVRKAAIVAMGEIVPLLKQEEMLARVLEMEKRLKDRSASVSGDAADALVKTVPHLKPGDRLGRVLKVVDRLGHSYSERRAIAINAIPKLVPHLRDEERKQVMFAAVNRLGIDRGMHNVTIISLIERLVTHLDPEGRRQLASQLNERLNDPDVYVRWGAIRAIAGVISHLEQDAILPLTREVAQRMTDSSRMVRLAVRSALEEIRPHLNREQQRIYTAELFQQGTLRDPDAGLGDSQPDQDVASMTTPTSPTPEMDSESLLEEAIGIVKGLGSMPWSDWDDALNAFAEIIPNLAPPDRTRLARKINEWYGKYDSFHLKRALEKVIPHLEPGACQKLSVEIAEQLLKKKARREFGIELLDEITERLMPDHCHALAKKIEGYLENENSDVRCSALAILGTVVPHLETRHRLAFALGVEKDLNHRTYLVRNAAINALEKIIPSLKPEDRADRVRMLERRLSDRSHEVRESVGRALARVIPSLTEYDFPAMLRKLEARMLKQRRGMIGILFAHALSMVASRLNRAERMTFMLRMDKLLADLRKKEQKRDRWWSLEDQIEHYILRIFLDTISLMRLRQRMLLLVDVIEEQGSWTSMTKDFLDVLVKHIPGQALLGFAKRHGSEDFMKLARYHAAGLPLDDYFWKGYIESPDPSAYLERISRKLIEYRRGKVFSVENEEEKHLAFAGLDNPEGIEFDTFAAEITPSPPPSPYLNVQFKGAVRSKRTIHTKVDKGRIKEALKPISKVKDADAFRAYLGDLVKTSGRELKRIRKELAQAYPKFAREMGIEEIVTRSRDLLPRIWGHRKNPAVRKLIYHLNFMVAWYGKGIENLIANMSAVFEGDASSDTLWKGLVSTEEFYRDTMEDTMREVVGARGDELSIIKMHRQRLKEELESAEGESGDRIDVEFVPSKSQADQFFGYVGEDCNKGVGNKLIYRDDFQVYRMISDDHLVGMLYLQRATLDGKKVLVMGIQPRSSWQVDHRDLLNLIEENFSRIADEEGYDFVMLMNDINQQSNRQDMLKAISERRYESVMSGESISGATFSGNKFLVMRKR